MSRPLGYGGGRGREGRGPHVFLEPITPQKPALAALVAAGTFDSRGADVGGAGAFDFGLARIRDGIERRLPVRARAKRRP